MSIKIAFNWHDPSVKTEKQKFDLDLIVVNPGYSDHIIYTLLGVQKVTIDNQIALIQAYIHFNDKIDDEIYAACLLKLENLKNEIMINYSSASIEDKAKLLDSYMKINNNFQEEFYINCLLKLLNNN